MTTGERLDAFYAALKGLGVTYSRNGGNLRFSAAVPKDILDEAKALKPWLIAQAVIDEAVTETRGWVPPLVRNDATKAAFEARLAAERDIGDEFAKDPPRAHVVEAACRRWVEAVNRYAQAGLPPAGSQAAG